MTATTPALVAAYRAGILVAFVMRGDLLARKPDIIRDGTGRPASDPAVATAWRHLREQGVIVQPLPGGWCLASTQARRWGVA